MTRAINEYSEEQIAELLPFLNEEERSKVISMRRGLRSMLTAPDPLVTALQQCIAARDLIEPAQIKIDGLIRKAEATGNDVEYQARCYQRDLIGWQLNRAADVAQKRLKHLDGLRNHKREVERIADGAEGAIHWFEYYAWGFDPRSDSDLALTPLALFEVQKGYIRWLEETVFLNRTSGVVPKSRDMGATVMTIDWCVLKWLTVSGFMALLGTRKDDLVDSLKKKDTLFEKARMQMRLLPKWMMPEGFTIEKQGSLRLLPNPVNMAEITGEAPVPHFGSQQRATVVVMDEYAKWPDGGYMQKTSVAGGTTKSIIEISSIFGKFNQFYDDWSTDNANVYVLNWHDHPWKDERWYNSLPYGYIGPKMSKEMIAQEIDMDAEASQPGRVWPMWSEVHTVVTMSELRRGFAKHGIYFPDDGDGRPRIPANCLVARLNDRGATAKHRNAWLWAWRPRDFEPFSDCVFIYREWLVPLGDVATFRYIVDNVRMFELPDDEDEKIELSLNSHEAESERINYAEEHDLVLEGWKTDYESGIAQMTEFLTVIDKDKDHPFRDPYFDREGNPSRLMGRTRLVIVTQDGQGEIRLRENGSLYVEPPRDHLGMLVIRRQIPGYHYPPEEAGKPAGAMRPQKIDDDIVDCARAVALEWGALIGTKSEDEEKADRMKAVNPGFAPEEIDKLTGWARQGRLAAMASAQRRLAKEEESANKTGVALFDYQERLRKQGYL